MLKHLDERERLVELAVNVRYTIHSKDVKIKKLFDKQKETRRIESLFSGALTPKNQNDLEFAEKIKAINEHFQSKNKKEG